MKSGEFGRDPFGGGGFGAGRPEMAPKVVLGFGLVVSV